MTEPSILVRDIIEYTKDNFDIPSANDVSRMLYYLCQKNHILDDEVSESINGIVPTIMERDKSHQTVNIPHVDQFNNNPKIVVNLSGIMSWKVLQKYGRKLMSLKVNRFN